MEKPYTKEKPRGYATRRAAEEQTLRNLGRTSCRIEVGSSRDGLRWYALGYRDGRETIEGPTAWSWYGPGRCL